MAPGISILSDPLLNKTPLKHWKRLFFNFKYVRLCDLDIPREKMVKIFVYRGDPDQTLHSSASNLGLH